MCQTTIALVSTALPEVTNAELLLKIKGIIALFIQTMTVRTLTPNASIVRKRLTYGNSLTIIPSRSWILSFWPYLTNMPSY